MAVLSEKQSSNRHGVDVMLYPSELHANMTQLFPPISVEEVCNEQTLSSRGLVGAGVTGRGNTRCWLLIALTVWTVVLMQIRMYCALKVNSGLLKCVSYFCSYGFGFWE